MTERQPLVGPPTAYNDRGFYDYGGGPIPTSYGHTITVRESSSAEGPHVWLFIDTTGAVSKQGDPHLNLAQAITLREALSQFIDSIPERWSDGADYLAEARREALGDKA